MTPHGSSVISIFRASDKKLLRYADDEGRTIATVTQGKIKVTSHGIVQGYYVRAGKLRKEGELAYTTGPLKGW